MLLRLPESSTVLRRLCLVLSLLSLLAEHLQTSSQLCLKLGFRLLNNLERWWVSMTCPLPSPTDLIVGPTSFTPSHATIELKGKLSHRDIGVTYSHRIYACVCLAQRQLLRAAQLINPDPWRLDHTFLISLLDSGHRASDQGSCKVS